MKPTLKKYPALRRHAIKKDAVRLSLYLLWLLAWLFGALGYNAGHQKDPLHRGITDWKLALWMLAAALIGFFLFRVYKTLLHPTVSGVILRTGLSHSYTHGEGSGSETVVYDFRHRTVLHLRTDKQKKRRVRFEQKTGSYLYYQAGEQILRFHGFAYPLNLNPTAPHGYVCISCGRIHSQYTEHCEGCALPLIDPKELNSRKQ